MTALCHCSGLQCNARAVCWDFFLPAVVVVVVAEVAVQSSVVCLLVEISPPDFRSSVLPFALKPLVTQTPPHPSHPLLSFSFHPGKPSLPSHFSSFPFHLFFYRSKVNISVLFFLLSLCCLLLTKFYNKTTSTADGQPTATGESWTLHLQMLRKFYDQPILHFLKTSCC